MEVEIPLPDGSLAPEGGGEPVDLDMILDRVIQRAQNEAMNEFLAGTSSVRIYSTEERRLHTTCLETAKKAMESFGLFE